MLMFYEIIRISGNFAKNIFFFIKKKTIKFALFF